MKKSLLTVLIFALVLVNLVLTIVMTISVVPQTKKANELITKVCNAIDLDLAAGDVGGTSSVSISNIETYDLQDAITINLKKGADGVQHYGVITVALSIDKTHEDYGKYSLDTYKSLIQTEIIKIMQAHTLEEVQGNQAGIQEEILEDIQNMFGSKFIFAVGFPSVTYQ